jgi:hydroxyacylglutathione hydrolase
MILEQFYLTCLAHASYLIADEKTGVAAVVDPQRDIEGYVQRAKELGVKIQHVLLTHFHADFVAGHLELQRQCGAKIYVGAKAEAEYDNVQLDEGDVIEFGNVRIEAMLTPGHTPEGVSFVVYDLAADATKPNAVLTGDTLFIGDVGRPDLLGAVGYTAEQLGAQLYDSLHDKLLKLPDDTLVYPAHGAGSMCGKALSKETVSTIGEQKKVNYALQPMSKDEFIALVTADQPTAPKYFLHDAILNRKDRPTLEDMMQKGLKALDLDTVLKMQAEGVQVVDTRDDQQFARGTLRGAYNIPLSGSFATWSGALLDLEQKVIVLADPGREEEAVTRLGRIGIDQVVGYVRGGFATVASSGRDDLVQTGTQITIAELREQLAGPDAPLVVDVRTPGEWKAGHIEGAVHIPLIELQNRLDELPKDRMLAVLCRTSNRSASAVSVLRRSGFDQVEQVLGGMSKWEDAQEKVGA